MSSCSPLRSSSHRAGTVTAGGTVTAIALLVVALAGCAAQSPAPVDSVANTPPPDPDAQYQENATPLADGDGARFEPLDAPEAVPPSAPIGDPGLDGDVASPAVPPPSSSAATALLTEAAGHRAAGNEELATASLERALRAAPEDGRVWLAMARTRIGQARYAEAEGLARRALELSAGNTPAEASAWNVIAEARDGIGDVAGAEAARQRSASLGGLTG